MGAIGSDGGMGAKPDKFSDITVGESSHPDLIAERLEVTGRKGDLTFRTGIAIKNSLGVLDELFNKIKIKLTGRANWVKLEGSIGEVNDGKKAVMVNLNSLAKRLGLSKEKIKEFSERGSISREEISEAMEVAPGSKKFNAAQSLCNDMGNYAKELKNLELTDFFKKTDVVWNQIDLFKDRFSKDPLGKGAWKAVYSGFDSLKKLFSTKCNELADKTLGLYSDNNKTKEMDPKQKNEFLKEVDKLIANFKSSSEEITDELRGLSGYENMDRINSLEKDRSEIEHEIKVLETVKSKYAKDLKGKFTEESIQNIHKLRLVEDSELDNSKKFGLESMERAMGILLKIKKQS